MGLPPWGIGPPEPPANPASSVVSGLESQIGPTLAAGQAGIAQAQEAQQLDPQIWGLQQGYNAQQYGNQMAGYGLQSGYNTQQYGDTQQQQALSQQGLGLQQQLLGTQEGIANGQYGLQQQGLAAQLGNLAYQLPNQYQGQQGAGAASGATNTQGQHTALGNIGHQYGFNVANIGREQQQADLSHQGTLAGEQYQQGQLGLQQQGLNLGALESQQGYNYGQAQLGLSQQGATQGYNYGQTTAGIQGALQAGQDQSALANQIAGQAQNITQAAAPGAVLQGGYYAVPNPDANTNTGN